MSPRSVDTSLARLQSSTGSEWPRVLVLRSARAVPSAHSGDAAPDVMSGRVSLHTRLTNDVSPSSGSVCRRGC